MTRADLSSPTDNSAAPAVTWSPPERLAAGEVLRASGTLFQLSWPTCLPLALLGVVASGAPGAEAVSSGEARGLAHSGPWWGLYLASMLLTLVCYGAVLLRQQGLVQGEPLRAFDALRRSALRLPQAAATAVLYLAAAPLLLPLVWLSLAWTVALAEDLSPLAACRRSIALVRGRALALTGSYLTGLVAVLVFVMLVGIFFGVIMSVAGQGGARTGVALSRVLFAGLLSLPVVFLSALLVSVYSGLRLRPQHQRG